MEASEGRSRRMAFWMCMGNTGWAVGHRQRAECGREQTIATEAFPVDGGAPVKICLSYCQMVWDRSGKFAYLYTGTLSDHSYALPLVAQTGLPKLPPEGVAALTDL